MNKLIAAIALAALVCTGCRVDRARYRFTPIPGGVVATPGVTITAEDGSFRLIAGQPFQTPFNQGDQCLLEPTAGNYPQGIATGARPVVIDFADGKRIYGLLSLCGAPPSSTTAPAARQYQIQVPDSYIAETAGGRVSVVFEWFTTGTLQAKSWILWLSETSFARQPAAAGGGTPRSVVDAQLDTASSLMAVSKWSGIIGGALGLVGLATLTSDPEGGQIALGVVASALGGTALIIWPVFFSSAKKEEGRIQTQLGSLDDYRRESQIARPQKSPPTIGWAWSF